MTPVMTVAFWLACAWAVAVLTAASVAIRRIGRDRKEKPVSMSVTELAALPTAPTISTALREAATYTDQGPHQALRRALFGTTTYEDFAAVVTPDHAIAEGVALVVVAGLIDPIVSEDRWPDASWSAGYFSERVRRAHDAITGWTDSHNREQLARLFEAAADRAQAMEALA